MWSEAFLTYRYRCLYFFWGHLRSLICKTPVVTDADLVARILATREANQNRPGISEKVRQKWCVTAMAAVKLVAATVNSSCE